MSRRFIASSRPDYRRTLITETSSTEEAWSRRCRICAERPITLDSSWFPQVTSSPPAFSFFSGRVSSSRLSPLFRPEKRQFRCSGSRPGQYRAPVYFIFTPAGVDTPPRGKGEEQDDGGNGETKRRVNSRLPFVTEFSEVRGSGLDAG